MFEEQLPAQSPARAAEHPWARATPHPGVVPEMSKAHPDRVRGG